MTASPPPSTRAYIVLGSNAGDRVGFVQQAMQWLKDIPQITVVECSNLYETEPTNRQYKEWFVNAVAALETTLSVDDLYAACKSIEIRLTKLHAHESERPEMPAFKKRIIHLDILYYGEGLCTSQRVTVPHPYAHKRAYALVPLLEIAPDLEHPTLGKTMLDLHEMLTEPEMCFLYGTRGMVDDLI